MNAQCCVCFSFIPMAFFDGQGSNLFLWLGLFVVITSLCHSAKSAEAHVSARLLRENSTVSKAQGEGDVHHGKLLIWQRVLQDVELEGNKSASGSLDADAHYQSDMGWETQQFPGAGDGFARPDDAVEQLLNLEPKVECTGDSMKLRVHDAASTPGSLFYVDRGRHLSPLPLLMLPPSCGYTIRSTQTDLALVAPYDGCFVTLEKDVYVLPLLWSGVRLRMLCPLTHSSPNPPMVMCHAGGMVVKTEWTTPVDKIKVNLNSQWEPLMKAAPRCGFSVVIHPDGVVVSARYNPCLHKKDGMYTIELTGDGETKISCPSLSTAPPEVINSLAVGQFQQLSYPYHIAPSENPNVPTNLAGPHIPGQHPKVPQSQLPYFPFVPSHVQPYPGYPEMRQRPQVSNKHVSQSPQILPTGKLVTPEEQMHWPLNPSPHYTWSAQQPDGPPNPEYALPPIWPALKRMPTVGTPPVYQHEDVAKHPPVTDAQSEKIKDYFSRYSFYPHSGHSQKSIHTQNFHPLVPFPLYFGQPKPSTSEAPYNLPYPLYYDAPKQPPPDSLFPGGQQLSLPFNPLLAKPLVYESPQRELQQPFGPHLTDQFYPSTKSGASHQEHVPSILHTEVPKPDGPADLSPGKSATEKTGIHSRFFPHPFYSQPQLRDIFQGQVHQTIYPYPYPFGHSYEKSVLPGTEISKGQEHLSFYPPQPMIPGAETNVEILDQLPGKGYRAHPPLFPHHFYTQHRLHGVPPSQMDKLVYPYPYLFDHSSEKSVVLPGTEISRGEAHHSFYTSQPITPGAGTNVEMPAQPKEFDATKTLRGPEPEILPAGHKMRPQEPTKGKAQESIVLKQSKFGMVSQGLQPGVSYMPPVYCPQICPPGLSNCCVQIAFHQHNHYFFPPGIKGTSPVYTGLPSLLGMTHSALDYNLRSTPVTEKLTETTNEQFHTTASTPIPTESQYDWQPHGGNPATPPESEPNKFTQPELSMHPYLVPHNLQYPTWPYQPGQLSPPVFQVPSILEDAGHSKNPTQEFESHKMHYNEFSSGNANIPKFEQRMQPYFTSDNSQYQQSDQAKPQYTKAGEELQPSHKMSGESGTENLKSNPPLIPYDSLQDDQAPFNESAVLKNSSQPQLSVTDPKISTHQQMVYSGFEPKGYVLLHRGPPSRESSRTDDSPFRFENLDHKRSNLLVHVLAKHHGGKSQDLETLNQPQGTSGHSKWMGKVSSEDLIEDKNIPSPSNKETDGPLTFSATDGFHYGPLPEELPLTAHSKPELHESLQDFRIPNTPLGSDQKNPLQFSLKNLQRSAANQRD